MELVRNDSRNYKTRPNQKQIIDSAGWQLVIASTTNLADEILCPCKSFFIKDIWGRINKWYAWAATQIMRNNVPINIADMNVIYKETMRYASSKNEISKETIELMFLLINSIFTEIRKRIIFVIENGESPDEIIDKIGYLLYNAVKTTILCGVELTRECLPIFDNNTKCSQCFYNKKCNIHDQIVDTSYENYIMFYTNIYNLGDCGVNHIKTLYSFKQKEIANLKIYFSLYTIVIEEKLRKSLIEAKNKFDKITIICTNKKIQDIAIDIGINKDNIFLLDK